MSFDKATRKGGPWRPPCGVAEGFRGGLIAGLAFLTLSVSAVRPAGSDDGADTIGVEDRAVMLRIAAWVNTVGNMCIEDQPAISGHLFDELQGWKARNPAMQEVARRIEIRQNTEEDRLLATRFEQAKALASEVFEAKRENDYEDFARECDNLTKELARGHWD